MPTGIRPPAAAAPYQTVPIVDFRGGLNRTRDTPEVGSNQVMAISNFDLDAGGGLKLRPGTLAVTANMVAVTGSTINGRSLAHMGFYGDSQGGEKILVGRGDAAAAQVWCPTSGTVRTLTGTNAAHFYRLAGYTIILAHVAATHEAIRIDDGDILTGAITTMAEVYEDDYETPTSQGHPSARYGCVQHYRAWIVDESRVNRVRFSHPNDPRFWHSDDWIDVGPIASDIVGIYPLGDVVLVVKQDSVWYIQGDVLAAMRLRRIDELVSSSFADAYTQRSSVMSMGMVWVWTKGDGLVSVGPSLQITKHAEQLSRFGDMPNIGSVSAADGKIFCREWSYTGGTYVYDPALDGWTFYSSGTAGYPMSNYTNVTLGTFDAPGDEVTIFIDEGYTVGGHLAVQRLNEASASDTRGSTIPITASVRTGWIVGQGPTEVDKWGRPRILLETIDDNVDLSGNVSVYKNLEPDVVSTTAWTLDESEEGRVKNVRGPSGGRGESISYELTMTGGRAYLHAIVPRFRPQRIKR